MNKEFISLINKYCTPFAIVLILSALVFVNFEKATQYLVIILLGISVILNMLTAWLVKIKPEKASKIALLRLSSNLTFNILFMYIIGSFWGPLWLLFLLTPLAMSLYSSTKITLAVSISTASLLLLIYGLRGMHGSVGWGQAFNHAFFIVFISMFVNSLAKKLNFVRQ
ncbi:MAG: hypothetical protein ABII27_01335 [bacterium]